jgi:type II secretory pathway component PulF
MTACVLACSQFVIEHAKILLFSLLLLIAIFIFLRKEPSARKQVQRQLLKFPLIKTVALEAAIVRFSRACSTPGIAPTPLIWT